jgi:hypothetical protein
MQLNTIGISKKYSRLHDFYLRAADGLDEKTSCELRTITISPWLAQIAARAKVPG